MLPNRLTFFGEGLHAFLLIFRAKGRMEQAAFESNTLGHGRLIGPIHGLLGHHGNRPRHASNLFRRLYGVLKQRIGRHYTGDQPRAFCLGGIHHTSGQTHLHGLRLANGNASGAGCRRPPGWHRC